MAKREFKERTKKLDEKSRKLAKQLNEREKKFHEVRIKEQSEAKRRKNAINNVKNQDLEFIQQYTDRLIK